jgi:glycosyltransferase involved in cell wall biosynthesis
VQLLGWGSAQTVHDEILRARALVLPSLAEGLPVVIMEALALGRPVVATDVAAVGELVRTGETGWLVPPGDVAGLVAALREVATTDDDVLRSMGRQGAVAVRARHDIDVLARQLSDLFAGECSR